MYAILTAVETGINQITNVDFGADYKKQANTAWGQGKYLQSVLYSVDGLIESAIDVVLAPTAIVTSTVDNFFQKTLGLDLDEMAMTLQANGLLQAAGETLYYATQWAKTTAVVTGNGLVTKTINIGTEVVNQTAPLIGVDSSNVIYVTKEKVALPPGLNIPENLVENPYRSGSYGKIVNGKYMETLRIDPPTPAGRKGPEYSHFHINGDKEHITDVSKWLE